MHKKRGLSPEDSDLEDDLELYDLLRPAPKKMLKTDEESIVESRRVISSSPSSIVSTKTLSVETKLVIKDEDYSGPLSHSIDMYLSEHQAILRTSLQTLHEKITAHTKKINGYEAERSKMLKEVQEKEEKIKNLERLEEGLVEEQHKRAEVNYLLAEIDGDEEGVLGHLIGDMRKEKEARM